MFKLRGMKGFVMTGDVHGGSTSWKQRMRFLFSNLATNSSSD